ncbi:MAG TPA: monovalent cation/H(+) antiporter subunit G [Membranihabitans sp.]|nr:monovalent cation/H(+) antiporter subunit G [Membranihabitans sp.]
MMEILIVVLSTLGAIIILIAAIGILRMPDFYLRLSVTVKAATLGVGIFLLCAAMEFPFTEVPIKSLAIIFFLLMTSPVAAHMIGRRAFRSNIPMWKDTWVDELEETYQQNSNSSINHGQSPQEDQKYRT